ncbi:hypothetical protein GCM10007242_39010 [Pigmentiphaga litoralis]|uniref:DUF2474 domain-containing protein n=1 Tax=Pigmentiphaga litoralis TaxID=516702 RepID=UPI001677FACC|nr:DUF2474 domain-containing protein [Pigmentiphaga litoralis]GGX28807.1 hypothetical protein GCM10007242_39010 [Pigmentiphaga litoralis]
MTEKNTSTKTADTINDIQRPWWKRMGWLLLIWGGSVAALGVVAWLFRMLMRSAGMMPPGA